MFHVPEPARVRDHPVLASTTADGNNGAFFVSSPEHGWRLAIIASDGDGWEHVSVHCFKQEGKQQRAPNWREMCFVKDLFWDDEDVVMQLHPKRSEYVNMHQFTLHLWRPLHATIPTPPPQLVGVFVGVR